MDECSIDWPADETGGGTTDSGGGPTLGSGQIGVEIYGKGLNPL